MTAAIALFQTLPKPYQPNLNTMADQEHSFYCIPKIMMDLSDDQNSGDQMVSTPLGINTETLQKHSWVFVGNKSSVTCPVQTISVYDPSSCSVHIYFPTHVLKDGV